MITELIQHGCEAMLSKQITPHDLKQELSSSLAIQHEQIETIGLMLEACNMAQIDQLPDNYMELVGHLLQFHIQLARQLTCLP